jgi:hypothetical protein
MTDGRGGGEGAKSYDSEENGLVLYKSFSGRRKPSWAGLCDIVRFEE